MRELKLNPITSLFSAHGLPALINYLCLAGQEGKVDEVRVTSNGLKVEGFLNGKRCFCARLSLSIDSRMIVVLVDEKCRRVELGDLNAFARWMPLTCPLSSYDPDIFAQYAVALVELEANITINAVEKTLTARAQPWLPEEFKLEAKTLSVKNINEYRRKIKEFKDWELEGYRDWTESLFEESRLKEMNAKDS